MFDSGWKEFANLLYANRNYQKENAPQVRKVVIGVPEYMGSEVAMQFDLPASRDVADLCGLILYKKK